jgi:hypothetical protein
MFESLLIRQSTTLGTTADAGILAEALLFYKQVNILLDRGVLTGLLKSIGPDDLIGLIKDGYIKATLVEDNYGTITNTNNGIEEHNFTTFRIAGHKDNKKRYSREDVVYQIAKRSLGDHSISKKFAKKLIQLTPHSDINRGIKHPKGISGIAHDDLDDLEYVRSIVHKVLELYVPNYAKARDYIFDVIKTDAGFIIATDIDYAAANSELQQTIPKEYIPSLSNAFLIGHVLSTRAEMLLASQYMSEIVTTPLQNALLAVQFNHLLIKRDRNSRELENFQDIFLHNGYAVREAINSGERSFSEFRKVLDKAQKFKHWLEQINPSERLIAEYHKSATEATWIDALPVKMLRFAICTGAGFITSPIAGIGTSAVDAFLVDKVLQGWRPSHFVTGPLLKFVDPQS